MKVYLTQSFDKYKFITPPGINQIADSMLLLHFAGEPITEAHINALSHAIPDMKGIFWIHTFLSSAMVDETTTAFKLMETTDQQLVKSVVDYSNTNVNRKFHQKYSLFRISWIEGEQIGKVVTAYSGSPPFTSRAIALIPFNDETAWQWGSITYGLAWFTSWRFSSPQDREWVFLIDEFLLNYLKLTIYIGGIPSLPFDDIDAQKGLVFFGRIEQLEQVYQKMSAVAGTYTEDEFEKYYKRYDPALVHRRVRM